MVSCFSLPRKYKTLALRSTSLARPEEVSIKYSTHAPSYLTSQYYSILVYHFICPVALCLKVTCTIALLIQKYAKYEKVERRFTHVHLHKDHLNEMNECSRYLIPVIYYIAF